MLTDNHVMVDRLIVSPAVSCVQRKATKKIVSEDDVVRANLDSFGNDIGKVTNRVTSMFEVQSHFDEDSEEYKILDYRIKCGQLIQQNVIDKSKGIVAKPMPRVWYDRHSLGDIEDDEKRSVYRSILADRKPYFMRYIYPDLMKQYNTYMDNTKKNALREFRMTVDELRKIPYSDLTERQKEFLRYYDMQMPVGTGDCVMNKICRRFENEFGSEGRKSIAKKDFDSSIMKSDAEYTALQFNNIRKLYEEYNRNLKDYCSYAHAERIDTDESMSSLMTMREQFMRECAAACPDERILCNIVIDLCYKKNGTKKFAWDMCGRQIIKNLMNKNGGAVSYPVKDADGDISYCGEKFSVKTFKIGEDNEHNIE